MFSSFLFFVNPFQIPAVLSRAITLEIQVPVRIKYTLTMPLKEIFQDGIINLPISWKEKRI